MRAHYLLAIALLVFNHTIAQTDTTKKIFTFVEQNPQFPGGDAELMRFLQHTVVYPEYERDHDIQGKVLTRFVVDTDGAVIDVSITRSVSPGLDAEAIRVVKMLPKFKPGTQQGKAVRVYFNLPLVFRLQDDTPKEQQQIAEKIQRDAYFKKAVTLMRENKFKEATSHLKTSIAKFPNDYLSYETLALCEVKLGKQKDACAHYQKAKELGSPNAAVFLSKNCN